MPNKKHAIKNQAYERKVNAILNILDTNKSGDISVTDLENATKTHYANVNRKKSGNLGINELKKLIRTDKQATDILEILNRLKAGEKKEYDRSIDDIFEILDKDKSGTIDLQELSSLYPDAAESLFQRFDLDNSGDLDSDEFKEFINSIKLAKKILKRLQAEEHERNIIKICGFLMADLSESITLKELNATYPFAANYLYFHFNFDENFEFGYKELKTYINSYTLSKEFLNALKTRQKIEFKHRLFDCYAINYKMCLYVTFCHGFAIADLSVLIDDCGIDNLKLRWWLVMLACAIPFPHIISIYIAWAASQQIANKLSYAFDTYSCFCVLEYSLCWFCKICQIANQLGEDQQGFQCPQTVELVTKINTQALIKNMLACEKNFKVNSKV